MKERVERALLVSEEQLVLDSLSILDSILPDNDNFTVYDAELWEQRLGLISNPLVSLADRKLAIIRKMNHPGDILARQSADYIQGQLQLAGFNVYVHENLNGQSPQSIIANANAPFTLGSFQLNDQQLGDPFSVFDEFFDEVQLNDSQLGDFQLSENVFNNKVVNNIEAQKDVFFNYGSIERTFVIGGQTFGTFADVDNQRELEFRQLILKLKPAQTVGFLLINYI